MQSMTGFSCVEKFFEAVDVAVDIRTFNSRYLDFRARLPKELAFFEGELRKEVQSRLRRGRIEVCVSLAHTSTHQYELNESVVRNYLAIAEKMRSWGMDGALDLSTLFQCPGVITTRRVDSSSEPILNSLLETVREALDAVVVARRSEGANLKTDLENRIQNLEKVVERVAGEVVRVREHYREKLVQRLSELNAPRVLEENRLTQEIFFYAGRSDISEEVTRLRSHIGRFRQYLVESDHREVGKSLEFLCQEMNREINTILSKSPLAEISEISVEGKSEIEKIREQVQNVE